MERRARLAASDYQAIGHAADTFEWNAQNITFVASLVVQFLVLAFSIFTLFVGNPPEVLSLVLTLESVVQGVELAWYVLIGSLFRWGQRCFKRRRRPFNFGVEFRYFDWYVTTPLMLITLFFLCMYFHNPCMREEQLAEYPRFVGYLVLIVLMDWAMLTLGLVVELDVRNVQQYSPRLLLALGFLPFFAAFTPHFDVLAQRATTEGIAVVAVTIVLWAVYGAVSLWLVGKDTAQTKNAWFNILDIFSKNVAGVVVSIVALAYDPDAHGCPSPPPPPAPPLAPPPPLA